MTAKFRISTELLAEGLHLPVGVHIVKMESFPEYGVFWIHVAGDGIPVDVGSDEPLLVTPVVTRTAESFTWEWQR